jgi:hypothetical protein
MLRSGYRSCQELKIALSAQTSSFQFRIKNIHLRTLCNAIVQYCFNAFVMPSKHLQAQLEKIAPTWMNISLKMKEDVETDKAFGWVLEMYAYAVASALHGVHYSLRKDFMIQPPWDAKSDNTFIIHYTYGCDYTLKGELTYGKIGEWRFDKRSYLRSPPPRNLTLPPPGVPESVVCA